MALRFFGVISTAMLIAIVALVALIVALGIGPPRAAQVDAEQVVVLRQAMSAFRNGGEPALRRLADDLQGSDVTLTESVIPAGGVDCAAFDGPSTRAFTTGVGCVIAKVTAEHLTLWQAYRPLTVPMSGGLLIGAISAIILARHFSRPLQTISEKLTALSSGDFSTRIEGRLEGRSDEIGHLARAFNRSATQLQLLDGTQRRLFHDVSHEIRSPLARLQAAAGMLRRSPSKLDTMLPRIEGEISKLDALIGQILTLARATRGDWETMERQDLDLVDLIESIVEDASFEGQTRAVSCRYSGPAALPASGSGELLYSALENVIRNAIRHAPSESEVLVTASLSSGDRDMLIEVSDRGPGVPDNDLDHIFAPFVRADGLEETCGAGLGLAITARVVAIHGGTALAKNRADGGLSVILHLPLSRHPG